MRYFIGVVVIVILTIFAIVMLVTRGPSTPNGQSGDETITAADYATRNSEVVFIQQGRLVGEESRRSVRVTVTPSLRTVEELSGYDQQVVRSQSYPNTQAAYEYFLRALDIAGFTRERESQIEDERGVCPQGTVYVQSLAEEGREELRLWSSSCGRDQRGTAGANPVQIRQLFQNQIPEYNVFVRPIRL